MFKKIWFIALLLCFISLTAVAKAERISLDFDDLSIDQHLSDQFEDKGVIFSGTWEPSLGTSGLIETEPAFGTYFFGNSEPNFVIVGIGSLTATFYDPHTGNPSTVSNVSFRIGDADSDPEAIGINAFDLNGDVIFSKVVHLLEEGTTIRIRRGQIAKVRVFGINITSEYGAIGFAIDDFSWN